MLLSKSYDIIKSVMINLVFDDNSTKKEEISLKDIVNVVYNKNGTRRTIEGTVTRIETGNACSKREWYMIVDGSFCNSSHLEHVKFDNIIDIDIVRKAKETKNISSPVGEHHVSNFRIVGNILQLSQDRGKTWLKVCELPEQEVIVDPTYQTIADKISSTIPKHMPPDKRAELIENLVDLFKEELDNTNSEESVPDVENDNNESTTPETDNSTDNSTDDNTEEDNI